MNIQNKASDQRTASIFLENEDIDILCLIEFQCSIKFTREMVWNIKQVDSDNNPIGTINLSSNPSAVTSEIIVSKGTLQPGMYIFEFQLKVSYMSGSLNKYLTDTDFTYIKITPSELFIVPFEYDVSLLKISINDNLNFKPRSFSYLTNHKLPTEMLNYDFYCRAIDLDVYSPDLFDIEDHKLQPNSTSNCSYSTGNINELRRASQEDCS